MDCFKAKEEYPAGYKFSFDSASAVSVQRTQFPNNSINTTKYTILSFFPLALLFQFKRLANIYFLLIAILQTIPILSPFAAYTAWAPLIIVLSISMLREGLEFYGRWSSDRELNSSPCVLFKEGQWREGNWTEIQVGDFVRVEDGQFFPADMLLLNSSLEDGVCFIETAALDGEKNLKRKVSDELTVQMYSEMLGQYRGQLSCMKPNAQLYHFEGSMELGQARVKFNNGNSLLLRGAKLKNTKWVVGLVIYVGVDSKVMRNSDEPLLKQSQVERKVNLLLVLILCLQLSLALLCAVGDAVFYNLVFAEHAWYLSPPVAGSIYVEGVVAFFSHLVLFNTMIPISLVVSMEIIKFTQAYLISNDILMRSLTTRQGSKAFTSTLNEELGQIEYVFSDKTGTLTCNVMEFKLCLIGGELFGSKGVLSKEQPASPKYSFEDPELEALMRGELKREMEPYSILSKGGKALHTYRSLGQMAEDFFLCLSMAHECLREYDEKLGKDVYQGPSPDEITLVDAARLMGFKYLTSSSAGIKVEVKGKPAEYDLLELFPFNSDRKRMSIVVRINGVLRMFTKGADSIIKRRLTSTPAPFLAGIEEYLTQFSRIGLRTLLIATKVVEEEEYRQYKRREGALPEANRDALHEELVNSLEEGLTLLGATAVEDKLQPNLAPTIADLLKANIKVWMLTGDKMETAENIARSCDLIQPSFKVFRYENRDVGAINQYLDRVVADMTVTGRAGLKKALLVEGEDLGEILQNLVAVEQMANIAKVCEVVVCCRVTPKQKAQMVALVKNKLHKITLAIGDGANDVNMIQEAHIGVGLYGQEGMRAVQSSDYALPEFQYLWRLLLVHGRWNYLRISEMILYFFYKNIVFTIPQFYFAFYCGFSGQSLFGQNYVALYNLAFTSIPLIVKALFEQDINYLVQSGHGQQSKYLPAGFVESGTMKGLYPQFYYLGQRNTVFNSRNFGLWYGEGLLAGLVITVWSVNCLEDTVLSQAGTFPNYDMTSLVAYSAVIVVVTVKLATHTRFWNVWFFLLLVLCSFAIYVAWMFFSNLSLLFSQLAFSVLVYFQTGLTYFVVGFCLCLLLAFDGLSLYFRDNVTDWRVGLVRQTLNSNPDYIEQVQHRVVAEDT